MTDKERKRKQTKRQRKSLFPEERLDRIASLVVDKQRVSVAELSSLFDVSKVTIRNDLDELEQRGLLMRTHGGALAIDQSHKEAELSFDVRERLQQGGKNRIRIALEFIDSPHITVVMPGGILRRDAVSLVGELGEEVLAKFNVQKGFFGARGVTLEEGLTDVDSYEVQLKRAMVRAAKEVIAIVDHTKWGHVGFVSFASIDQVDCVITDDGAPPDMVAALREAGVDVIIA
jgi:DeoR/GlpR family transcriptional regulator of sugar metabolism